MQNLLAQLKEKLGNENFFEDRASIIALSSCFSKTKNKALPLAVLHPRHEGHIRGILHFCREHNFTLRIMGGGTSDLRQKPLKNELLFLTSAFNRILSLEEENRSLVAQSGLSLASLEKHLASTSLFFPFQAPKNSPATLGGLMAANMPNLYSLAYGYPGIFVQELELFLSNGEKCLMSCQNNQPFTQPFPLAPLFIGSQGQLGLISTIKIRLLPRPPARKSFIIPCVDNMGAIQASSLVLNSDLTPTALELISADIAQVCTSSSQPCLFISFSGSLPYLTDQENSLYRLFETSRPRQLSEEENEAFLARYAVWIIKLQSQQPFSSLIRIACPQNKLSYFIDFLDEILNENNIKAAFSIHIGLSYIRLLLWGSSLELIKQAEKKIFTIELMLNNKMTSEKESDLTSDEWRKFHDEDMHISRKIAEILDPDKIFSASLF